MISITSVIKQCWDKDPDKRLTAQNLLRKLNTIKAEYDLLPPFSFVRRDSVTWNSTQTTLLYDLDELEETDESKLMSDDTTELLRSEDSEERYLTINIKS